MVLETKYSSALLASRSSIRMDPGSLHTAGLPAGGSAAVAERSASPSARRTLIAAKPNNRLRHLQPAVELRVPGAAAQTNLSSSARSDFSAPVHPEKSRKYDFSMSLNSMRLGGLGRSVQGLDSTAEWRTTKSHTIDSRNAAFAKESLVSTRNLSLATMEQEQWKSTTRTSYGSGCHSAVQAGTASPDRRKSGVSTLQLA